MENEYTLVQTLYYYRHLITNGLLTIVVVVSTVNLIRKILKDIRDYECCKQCNRRDDSGEWGNRDRFSVIIQNSRVRSIFSTHTRSGGKSNQRDDNQ